MLEVVSHPSANWEKEQTKQNRGGGERRELLDS